VGCLTDKGSLKSMSLLLRLHGCTVEPVNILQKKGEQQHVVVQLFSLVVRGSSHTINLFRTDAGPAAPLAGAAAPVYWGVPAMQPER
jgi:hypothetical protein